MKRFLSPLFFLCVASSVSTLPVRDQPHCCGDYSISLKRNDFSQCEDGQKPNVTCRQGFAKVTHGFDFIVYDKDASGRFMTAFKHDENSYGFEVHAPYYCVANQTTARGNRGVTVLYCIDRSRPMREDSSDHDNTRSLIFLSITMLFLVSGLLLGIAAVIYFILPQTQNVEEKCTFHLILNQCFFSLLVASRTLAESNDNLNPVKEHCAVFWYLFVFTVMSFLTWSALLAYHMWNRFGQYSIVNESTVMYRYLPVGYGIPALLVILSNIHIHWSSFSRTNNLYQGCFKHSSSEYTLIYAALPAVVIESACAYFFISLHRKLWNEHLGSLPQHSISNIKKYKFRLVLNAKLILLTGLPYVLIIVFSLLAMLMESFLFLFIVFGLCCFIPVDGIIVFFMLVVRRKRILRGLAEKFGLTVTRWQPCPEEEPIESGNENENEPNRELSAYTD